MRHIGVVASSCRVPSICELSVVYMVAKAVAKILNFSMVAKFLDVTPL